MTRIRRALRSLCLCLLAVVCLSAIAPVTVHAAKGAKAQEAVYTAVVKKKAVLTPVKKTGKKVKLKKATTVQVISRTSKKYIIVYKKKTYKVDKDKVTLGAMSYNSTEFTQKSAEKFVNSRNYSSKTKYLVWVSFYSQHVYIFKGKKGNWKLIHSCICSTGAASTPSPYARSTKSVIWGKQYVWYYNGVPCANYASRIPGGAIHTWSSGGFGVPRSHGCVRVPTSSAMFIYNKLPLKTRVLMM